LLANAASLAPGVKLDYSLSENALSTATSRQGNMARTRKSRPKAKAARASRARKSTPAGRKPADPLDGFIEAAARLLALPIEPQWLAAIKFNLDMNLKLAAFVAEFALPDETEPAPVFTA
jgi:hypothetical protein